MQVRSLKLKFFHHHGKSAFGEGPQCHWETVGKLRLREQMPAAQHSHTANSGRLDLNPELSEVNAYDLPTILNSL